MRTKEEFENFYNFQLKGRLEQLEAKRLEGISKHSFKTYKRILLLLFILIVIVIVLVKKYHALPEYFFFIVPASVLFAMFYPFYVLYKRSDNFTPLDNDFKTNVIAKIIKFVSSEFRYDSSKGISSSEFDSSGLYHGATTFRSEDLIHGFYNGLRIKMAEVIATKTISIKTTQKGRQYKNRQHDVFRGLYVIAETKTNISFPVLVYSKSILENKISTHLLNAIQNLNVDTSNDEEKFNFITTGDTAFDGSFNVRCPNPEFVYTILNDEIKKTIRSLKGLADSDISIAFLNNEIHFTISGNTLFEMDAHTSFTKSTYIHDYFKLINVAIGFAEGIINVTKNTIQ